MVIPGYVNFIDKTQYMVVKEEKACKIPQDMVLAYHVLPGVPQKNDL